MKKFAIAAVTAALLSAVHAEGCSASFTGFYAGVQAGINSTTGSSTISNYQANTADNDGAGKLRLSSAKTSVGKKSFLGGIFAGYGMAVGSCAYVGAELYGNFGNANEKIFDTSNMADAGKTFTVKMKRTYSFGAKVRLGYTISQQAMIFLGLGLEYAKLQLQATNIVPSTVASQNGVDSVTKKNKGKISFAPSVGMDVFLNKNLFVRGEYTYVLGIKQKINPSQMSNAGIFALSKQTADVKVNMTQQRFTLGLGYKF